MTFRADYDFKAFEAESLDELRSKLVAAFPALDQWAPDGLWRIVRLREISNVEAKRNAREALRRQWAALPAFSSGSAYETEDGMIRHVLIERPAFEDWLRTNYPQHV